MRKHTMPSSYHPLDTTHSSPPPCPYRALALRALIKQSVLNYRLSYKMRLSDIVEERSSTAEALERQSFEDEMRLVKQGSLSMRFSLYKNRVVASDAFESFREQEPKRQERTHLAPPEVPCWRERVMAWWLRLRRKMGISVDVR